MDGGVEVEHRRVRNEDGMGMDDVGGVRAEVGKTCLGADMILVASYSRGDDESTVYLRLDWVCWVLCSKVEDLLPQQTCDQRGACQGEDGGSRTSRQGVVMDIPAEDTDAHRWSYSPSCSSWNLFVIEYRNVVQHSPVGPGMHQMSTCESLDQTRRNSRRCDREKTISATDAPRSRQILVLQSREAASCYHRHLFERPTHEKLLFHQQLPWVYCLQPAEAIRSNLRPASNHAQPVDGQHQG